MRRLLREIIHGQWLRHRAVGLAAADQQPARAFAKTGGAERDVTDVVFPLSLAPLVLGLARAPDEPAAAASELAVRDESGEDLGAVRLASVGGREFPGGCLDLFVPTGTSVRCVPEPYLTWRYATAWRHMRNNAKRPHAYLMDFPDLAALNVFYMLPRPVYLVTVAHLDRGNMFPMDLVGPWGDDTFLLALHTTSGSIETICSSGRLAVSAAPATFKDFAYRLGSQHRERSVDWTALPFETVASPHFGLPVPAAALGVRELEVRHSEVIGSHRLFVTSVAAQSSAGQAAQLCHVSDMYARWRAARGRPFADA